MKTLKAKRGPKPALTRAEKTEATQRALFDAAVKVIGKSGYIDASIAKITQAANVAQGTFYNYFSTQQELFDQLLPQIGQRLIDRIRTNPADHDSPIERERVRFDAFFDFLLDVPEFYRLLTEAETFAPEAHRAHTGNMASGYVRALRRLHAEGKLNEFNDQDFEPIAYMLIGMRHYVAMRYSYSPDSVHRVPASVTEAYIKLLKNGLFGENGRKAPGKKAKSNGDMTLTALDNGQPRLLEVRSGYAIAEAELSAENAPQMQGMLANMATTVAQAASAGGEPSGQQVSGVSLMMLEPAKRGKLVATAQANENASNSVVNVSINQGKAGGRQIALVMVSFTQNPSAARPLRSSTKNAARP